MRSFCVIKVQVGHGPAGTDFKKPLRACENICIPRSCFSSLHLGRGRRNVVKFNYTSLSLDHKVNLYIIRLLHYIESGLNMKCSEELNCSSISHGVYKSYVEEGGVHYWKIKGNFCLVDSMQITIFS